MKKLSLFIGFVILAFINEAQNYKLSFSLEGEVNSIDSVIVENATQNTRIKLNGNDTLVFTKIVTGINAIKDQTSFKLKAFPNPTSSIVNLQFYTGKSENIKAHIFDIEGRKIVTGKWNVKQGIHTFQVKNLPTGVFVVKVSSESNSEQIKIVSLQEGINHPEISAIHSEQVQNIGLNTKSATEARLMGYAAYDNIVVRVYPFEAPWELLRGFTMNEEPPVEENNTFVFEYVKCEDKCGNVYNTVEIGDQIWMAENYRCQTENSWLYNNDTENEELYGRLYTWEDALNNAPEGWHLPSHEEWLEMEEYLNTQYGNKVPIALKSKTGWLPDENQKSTNGNDASGFNIVPAGARYFVDGTFYAAGERAYFWTSTKADSIRATIRKFTSSDTQIGAGNSNVDYGFSVRYVKDTISVKTTAAYFDLYTDQDGKCTMDLDTLDVGIEFQVLDTLSKPIPNVNVRLHKLNNYVLLYVNESMQTPWFRIYTYNELLSLKKAGITKSNAQPQIAFVAVIATGLVIWGIYDFVKEMATDPPHYYDITLDANVTKKCIQGDANDVLSTIGLIGGLKTLTKVVRVFGSAAKIRGVTSINLGFTYKKINKEYMEWYMDYWKSNIGDLDKELTICWYVTKEGKYSFTLPIVDVTDEVDPIEIVTDVDGNSYKTIQIGDQVWLAANLRTTKYNDGSEISYVTDNTEWKELSTGAYCWFDNDISYKDVYGALYNWHAINTDKLCPAGWHVPSDDEWTTLDEYYDRVSARKLKEDGTTHWNSPNAGATNESGFTALPGGYRYYMGTSFSQMGQKGCWWSSTEVSPNAWYRYMVSTMEVMIRNNINKNMGFSVRCIKD